MLMKNPREELELEILRDSTLGRRESTCVVPIRVLGAVLLFPLFYVDARAHTLPTSAVLQQGSEELFHYKTDATRQPVPRKSLSLNTHSNRRSMMAFTARKKEVAPEAVVFPQTLRIPSARPPQR